MNKEPETIVTALRASIVAAKAALRQTTGKQIHTGGAKDAAKKLVHSYFNDIRPDLSACGLDDKSLASLDQCTQDLLTLTQRSALRTLYYKAYKKMGHQLNGVEVAALVGPARDASPERNGLDDKEQAISSTLAQLIPTAALSYKQACLDLHNTARISFRGTGAELRETLREVLDHLAPDDDVMAQPGFNFEASQTKPTMKQKTRFILRSRGLSKTVAAVPENAIDAIGAMTRSLYNRSSVSTHTATTPQEVRKIKAYVDVVLAELLEI